MASSDIINERQLRILESLARYTYLTTDQLVRLGIASHTRNVRDRYLRPLVQRRRPLVGYADFHDGLKRLPRIQFLTQHGVEILKEAHQGALSDFYYPKGKVQFTRDYHHRVETIDCAIAFDLWAQETEQEIDLLEFYFQHDGSQRGKSPKSISKVEVQLPEQTLVADIVLRINMQDGESRLFVLELNRQPKAERLVEEIKQHVKAIDQGLYDKKYSHPFSHRVLSVFKHPKTMQSVIEELSQDEVFLAEYQENFLFADWESFLRDFPASWSFCDDAKSTLFKTLYEASVFDNTEARHHP